MLKVIFELNVDGVDCIERLFGLQVSAHLGDECHVLLQRGLFDVGEVGLLGLLLLELQRLVVGRFVVLIPSEHVVFRNIVE